MSIGHLIKYHFWKQSDSDWWIVFILPLGPPELAALGIRAYREVFFKPYRLIYRVEKRRVVVFLIADGRRDMQSLLARRLLSPSGRPES